MDRESAYGNPAGATPVRPDPGGSWWAGCLLAAASGLAGLAALAGLIAETLG